MTLQTVLARIAGSETSLDWDEWYALALAAHERPGQWEEAWAGLATEDREALLSRLSHDADPLSDYLIRCLLPNDLTDLSDPTLDLATDEALEAGDRQLRRLEEIRQRTHADVETVRRALNEHTRIEELQQEELRLRQEVANGPGAAQRQALEKEIERLRSELVSLSAYDPAERQQLRTRLQEEAEALRTEKQSLERSIRQARQERAGTEKDIAAARAQLAEIKDQWAQEQDRLASLQEQVSNLQAHIGQAQDVAQDIDDLAHGLRSGLESTSNGLRGIGNRLRSMFHPRRPDDSSRNPQP